MIAVTGNAIDSIAVVAAVTARHNVWPRERENIVNRARGAYANALTAPCTACVLGITIGTDDDLRVVSAISDVKHANDLNVLACANAARAQNARGHVMLNDRIAIAFVAAAK